MRSASASVVAMGFSQTTPRTPARAAAITSSGCRGGQVHTLTMSGRWGPRHASGTIGNGGRDIRASSVNGSIELRVRIFPDKIHLDSHEPDLTADEQTWGQHYWQQDWLAGNDTVARSDAWRQIADRSGANRAAWIIRVLQPTNADQRPTSPTPAGHPLTVAPAFPAVAVANQDAAWRRAPQARLLPDRWIAVVHSGGQVALTASSKDVQRPLNVGPNPQARRNGRVSHMALFTCLPRS